MATAKTNASRQLDQLNISHKILEYEVDPNDLAAESIPAKVNLPPEQVFKSLVFRGDLHGIGLAVIPGNSHLALKALAKLSGDRKVETVLLKEVQPLTGYIRGGVTALACKKPYPVYLDETAQLFDQITVSAGKRGLLLLLDPQDFLQTVHATLGPISTDKP